MELVQLLTVHVYLYENDMIHTHWVICIDIFTSHLMNLTNCSIYYQALYLFITQEFLLVHVLNIVL